MAYTTQKLNRLTYGSQTSDFDNSWQENMHRVVLAFPKTCCKQKNILHDSQQIDTQKCCTWQWNGEGRKQMVTVFRMKYYTACNTRASRTTQWRRNKDWISTKLELLSKTTWRAHDDNIQLCSIQKIGPFITGKFCSARNDFLITEEVAFQKTYLELPTS